MTSNDSQMRCNFVDLYYALYGSKRPSCLISTDSSTLSRLPRIPKLTSEYKYRSPSPPASVHDDVDDNLIHTSVIKIEDHHMDEPQTVPIIPGTPDIKEVFIYLICFCIFKGHSLFNQLYVSAYNRDQSGK